ncbi:MAG: amidohydrolase [Pirellulales bacterium]|nr:amidohydrolase [Pirellulales bacterium]
MSIIGLGPAAGEDMREQVEQLVEKVTPDVVAWRRDFHTHPELSNREERTSRIVAEQLQAMGADEVRTGVARHGVVALVRGKKPGPTVALRADMDALPIQEETGLPFASQNARVMHACGHDAHTAVLLGTAKVLVELRDRMRGSVKLLFQPAEEGPPAGEEGGARLMIKDGALDNPPVTAIFGLHINPELETGKISYRAGGMMAAVDRIRMVVTGKQSHGGMPWQGVDPVVASAHIITALQAIPSRHIDARQPVVVSIGVVRAEGAWNIIPEQVELLGTVRTHDPEVRRQVAEQFHRIVHQTAAAHGTKAEIVYGDYGPVLWNDPELTERAVQSLGQALGRENVVEAKPLMGGEDFAHYALKVPGSFFFLGVRNEKLGAVHALHTPKMVLDEAALPVGVRAMATLALDFLATAPQSK